MYRLDKYDILLLKEKHLKKTQVIVKSHLKAREEYFG